MTKQSEESEVGDIYVEAPANVFYSFGPSDKPSFQIKLQPCQRFEDSEQGSFELEFPNYKEKGNVNMKVLAKNKTMNTLVQKIQKRLNV